MEVRDALTGARLIKTRSLVSYSGRMLPRRAGGKLSSQLMDARRIFDEAVRRKALQDLKWPVRREKSFMIFLIRCFEIEDNFFR